jgi:uncharacterized membrane protein YeaQ/YmgE (transglycosylase-associated protein family)
VWEIAMSAEVVYLFVRIIAGAIAGNAMGAWERDCSLGQAGNTVLGIIGGLGGRLILANASGEQIEIGSIIGQLVAGGIGGALFTHVFGSIRNAMHSE